MKELRSLFAPVLAVISALILCFAGTRAHADENFAYWLSQIKQKAVQEGISSQTVNKALKGLEPVERVIALDRKQPEKTITFAEYKNRILSKTRIEKGREMMRRHARILNAVSDAYNVQPQYIVALWGIETNYGGFTGGFHVIPALATLAYDGRRGEFFTAELLTALKIADEGHTRIENMKGSWAGAMGQNQFMPSSFKKFSVDYNQDGRRDIWQTYDDIFASSANYLAKSGWHGDERWGRKIKLPVGFDITLVGKDIKKSLHEWRRLGLMTVNGNPIPVAEGMEAYIVMPDGPEGDVYLAYNNFETLLKWNRSTYFATSVGLLADLIAGG